MIVDPNTGQPLGISLPGSQSMVGQTGMDIGAIASIPPDSAFNDAMMAIPPAWVTTGWNMGRVQNTILGGGYASEARKANNIFGRIRRGGGEALTVGDFSYDPNKGRGGMLHRGAGFAQTARPRRLKRAANIDSTAYGDKSGVYSPFNFLASAGNTAVRNAERIPFGMGEKLSARLVGIAGEGVDLKKDAAFSPGTLGRNMTSHTIGRMKAARLQSRMPNIQAAIQDINPKYFGSTFNPLMQSARYGADMEYTRGALQGGLGSTNTGWISGRVSGFFDAAESAYQGNTAALQGIKEAAEAGSNYARGIDVGERFAAGETKYGGKMSAKFVGSGAARGVLRGVNVASYIMLGHDAAVFAGKMVGRTIDGAFAAANSVKGSLDKPVMGMGFRDNTVAATARQRGVMAIQNSRLNMRSALGSEASAMYAHFG